MGLPWAALPTTLPGAVVVQVTALDGTHATVRVPEPDSLPPGVHLSTELRPYRVRGRSRVELSRSMFDAAPALAGRRVWGRTEWRLESEYRFGPSGDGCAVVDARVGVVVVILLPRWVDRARATPALRRAWDAFHHGLMAHELGHRSVAVEAAAELRGALLEVVAPSCTDVRPEADRLTRAVMARWGARQVRYDVETRRGRSQGARWPP